jgi:hypothetical protein
MPKLYRGDLLMEEVLQICLMPKSIMLIDGADFLFFSTQVISCRFVISWHNSICSSCISLNLYLNLYLELN